MNTSSRKITVGQKFGVGGALTLISCGRSPHPSKKTTYKVHCAVCATDPELYGDGVFCTGEMGLQNGRIRCGCSKRFTGTAEQNTVLAQRHCDKRGLEFLGIAPCVKVNKVRIDFRCKICGKESNASLYSMISANTGCRSCSRKSTLSTPRASETVQPSAEEINSSLISQFRRTGAFGEGVVFRRIPGPGDRWLLDCPVCAEDELGKAGFKFTFKSCTASLLKGRVPCRCSVRRRLSANEAEYLISEKCTENGLVFMRWNGVYAGVGSRCTLYCETHGDVPAKYSSYMQGAGNCPECAITGFKPTLPAVVYVLKATSKVGAFTGYGISGYFDTRISVHRSALSEYAYNIDTVITFPAVGYACRDIEAHLKKMFPVVPQDMDGFRAEATHHHLFDAVVAYVEQHLPLAKEKYSCFS